LNAKGHNPSHVFRGHKADIYEGGHRVPFIVRWPGRVPAGGSSDRIVCLTDAMATCAAILETKLPDNAAEDSFSFLPTLLGQDTSPRPDGIVHHSINGSFAIRQGSWKLCLCPDSGGWSEPRPGKGAKDLPPVQLFDLSADVGERTNLASKHPETVQRLTELLELYVRNGRSTPGSAQVNTTPVVLTR
jgi:arylsulfatase A-like enzyme